MDHRFLFKLKKLKWVEVGLSLICTAFIFLIEVFNIPIASPLINQLDSRIYDQIVNLNWRPHQQDPKVVIIDIDENSVQKEGRWPWPRDKMADLLTKLKQNGVVTIGMDIVMSESEINYALGLKNKLLKLTSKPTEDQKLLLTSLDKIAAQVDNDQAFVRALLDHNVVLGFLFHNDPGVKKGALPPPLTNLKGKPIKVDKLHIYQFQGYNGNLNQFINAATKAGFVTNLPDKDGTVRHALMLANNNNYLYPSLSLATAMNYLLIDHVALKTDNEKLYGIQIDGMFIPTNSFGEILIPFWGQAGTLDYYSATDILQGTVNSKELEGSIAIIGSSMTLLADLHQTPVSQLFPGVELVGNMVQAIIGQQLIAQYDWHTIQGACYIVFFGVIFAILLPFLGVIGKLLLTFVTFVGILAGAVALFVFKNLYVPSAFLLTLIILQTLVNYLYSFIMERRQKRKISELFGQYVPKEYVKELIEFPEHYNMEGQTRTMSVQFTDIRNFTSISEPLDAIEVKHLLNNFFSPITEIIFSHRGTIDKYVGDMIVAFWGAPIEDEEHAYNAIMSSITIFKHLPEINAKMLEKDLPSVNIGIGLATGLMNVGDMGSEFRRSYTVIGDTVNLASRLQELTKFYKVNILVNDTTRAGQDAFLWRAIDKIAVKGRKSALTIYQPLGIVTDASPALLAELEEYKIALEHYYTQNWPLAKKEFGALRKSHPEVYLYQLYLERIMAFMKTPPPEDWNGVYIHSHK